MGNTASLRLTLERSGFVASVTALEKQGVGAASRIAARMNMVGASVKTWGAAAAKTSGALATAFAANPAGGMINGLKVLETRANASAKRVGQMFRAALASAFEQGPKVGGGRGADGRHLPGGGGAAGGHGGGSAFGTGLATNAISMARDLATQALHKGFEVTQEAGKTHEAAMQLSVNAHQGGEYVDPKQLENEFYATAAKVKGTTADEAAEAATKFVTLTGDLDTARSSLVTFAEVSKATGAKMGDVAEATASISRQFKITGAKDIQETLGALVSQGKKGAIMMPDLAAGLQRLASAGAAFGLEGVGGIKTLGGLTQIAKGGTGSPDQAFTATERVLGAVIGHAQELKAQKVNVYEGKGAQRHTRNITDILIDTVSKVGGNNIAAKNSKLQTIFGEEGIRAIKPLISAYQDAYRSAGGFGAPVSNKERKEAGVGALKKMFDEAINAGGSWDDVMRDSAQMQQTSTSQLTAAYESMKSKIASDVLPTYASLVTKLTQQSNAVDGFVEGLKLVAQMFRGMYRFAVMTHLVKEYKKPEEQAEMRNAAGVWEKMHREDFVGSELAKPYGDAAGQSAEFDKRLAKTQEQDAEGSRLAEVAELQKALEGGPDLKPAKPGSTQTLLQGAAVTGGLSYGGPVGAAAPTGPQRIESIANTVRVEIVSDRTARPGAAGGGGRTPAPGYTPRP